MSGKFLVLFFIVAVFAASAMSNPSKMHKKKCHKNEVWMKCGTPCEPTCKNPKPVCAQYCVSRCQCKKGLLRNKMGKCVELCNC